MKIAYYGFYPPDSPSGANVHMWQMIHHWVAAGHKVFTWIDPGSSGAIQLPRSPLRKWKILENCDVLYIRNDHVPAKICGYGIGWKRRLLFGRLKIVWEINSIPLAREVFGATHDQISQMEKQFQRFGRGCDLAVVVSQQMREYFEHLQCFSNCYVLPNGTDLQMFSPDWEAKRKKQKLQVVWMGSGMEAWHDFETIQNAATKLLEQNAPVEFYFIGSGLDQIKPKPGITIYGHKPYRELNALLSGMHVGLIAYRGTGAECNSPLKFFDYMGAGLCVLSRNHPQVTEILLRLKNPISPTFSSGEILAEKLQWLAENRESCEAMGRKLRELAENEFNWARNAKLTLEEILKLKGRSI